MILSTYSLLHSVLFGIIEFKTNQENCISPSPPFSSLSLEKKEAVGLESQGGNWYARKISQVHQVNGGGVRKKYIKNNGSWISCCWRRHLPK